VRKLHWSILKRLYRLRPRFAVYQRLERRWLLDNRNWIDQQLIIRRPYEVAQIARCRALIREHRLQSFFDIGANFGLYSVLLARETGVAFLACGHHATERYGAPAVGEHLAARFGLAHRFIEIDNPA